jgi:membrane dipeptidase
MNIAIIGASGFVGSALVNEAASRDYDITAIARNTDKIPAEDDRVNPTSVDVDSAEKLTGVLSGHDAGLTAFGQSAVRRLNELEMAIGLSHESQQTIEDVCAITADPLFLSHTAARGVWNTKRAQPDRIFELIADTGGVIAIEGAHSTRIEEESGHSIEGMMRHFEYVVDLVGIDHVTFATDTIYGNHEDMMGVMAEKFSVAEVFSLVEEDTDGFEPDPEHTHVIDNENPTEAWNNVPRWLIKNGYSDEDIEKVTGGNTLRALERIFE